VNNTIDLTADASVVMSNITANTYSAYNLANGISPLLVGAVLLLSIIVVLVFSPKLIKRLVIGYFGVGAVALGWGLLYGVLMSLNPIGRFGVNLLTKLGEFVLEYWLILLVSVPVAYLVGCKLEDSVDSEVEKMNEDEK